MTEQPNDEGVAFRPACVTCKDMVDKNGKAACDIGGCDEVEQPTKSPSEVKRMSNTVIRPETEAENSKVVSQPLEQLKITEIPMKCDCGWIGKIIECECDADYADSGVEDEGRLRCPQCSCLVEESNVPFEQPNTELLVVKTIQGLVSVVNRELGQLDKETKMLSCHRNSLVLKALEEIDLFEKTTLFELQKAFE